MEVNVSWDDDKKIAIVTYQNAKIDTPAHYQEWKLKLFRELNKILLQVGKKFPLAVDIDELSISEAFQSKYGTEVAPLVAKKYANAIARFGTNTSTKMVVSNQAVKRILESTSPESLKEYGANVFQVVEAATTFLLATTELRD